MSEGNITGKISPWIVSTTPSLISEIQPGHRKVSSRSSGPARRGFHKRCCTVVMLANRHTNLRRLKSACFVDMSPGVDNYHHAQRGASSSGTVVS